MRRHIFLIVISILVMCFALLGVKIVMDGGEPKEDFQEKIVVVSPHPVDFMRPLINEFETETGIMVEVIQAGTSKAIEMVESGEEIDVLWGGSVSTVGTHEDLFMPYRSENTESFYDEFKGLGDGITCFTDVPSIIMINTDLVGDTRISGYEDLLDPSLKGKIAFADPAKSSSSFEHLTNMLYAMGKGNPDQGWGYVEKLIDQLDGKILGSSSEVYRGVAEGEYLVGLTFEEAAITMLKAGYHVKIIYMEEGVVSTPDGIYITKTANNTDAAKKFVDFMTSFDAQQYIARDLGRRSVREDVDSGILVAPKESIKILTVDRDKVTMDGKGWIQKFSSMYGEDENE